MNYYKRVIAPRKALLAIYEKSPEWRVKRKLALERDGFQCRVPDCGATSGLQVHHLRYPSYPKKLGSEPISWLVTVCSEHHAQIHKEHRKMGVSLWDASRRILQWYY